MVGSQMNQGSLLKRMKTCPSRFSWTAGKSLGITNQKAEYNNTTNTASTRGEIELGSEYSSK